MHLPVKLDEGAKVPINQHKQLMINFTHNELVLLSAALQVPVLQLEIDLHADLDLASSLRKLIDINFYSN